MSNFAALPYEMKSTILAGLPPKDLMRCGQVSREWRDLIRSVYSNKVTMARRRERFREERRDLTKSLMLKVCFCAVERGRRRYRDVHGDWDRLRVPVGHPELDVNAGCIGCKRMLLVTAFEFRRFDLALIILKREDFAPARREQKYLSDLRQTYDGYSADTILHLALKYDEPAELARLILAKCESMNLNILNESGDSVLHVAARNGHLEVVNMLLDNEKVDANMGSDSTEFTALHHAVYEAKVDVVEALLLNPKVDPEIKCSFGRTPLALAETYSTKDVIEVLKKYFDIDC